MKSDTLFPAGPWPSNTAKSQFPWIWQNDFWIA